MKKSRAYFHQYKIYIIEYFLQSRMEPKSENSHQWSVNPPMQWNNSQVPPQGNTHIANPSLNPPYMNMNPYLLYLQQNMPPMNQNFPPQLSQSSQMPMPMTPMEQYHQAMLFNLSQGMPFFPGTQKGYKHPLPAIHHKVKYFDPSQAPLLTSSKYNTIENPIKTQTQSSYDQLLNAEIDEQPFIVFKDKRIKKRYKRYLGTDAEKFAGLDSEDSASLNSEEEYEDSIKEDEQKEEGISARTRQKKKNNSQQRNVPDEDEEKMQCQAEGQNEQIYE